jgi:hypothetical protein
MPFLRRDRGSYLHIYAPIYLLVWLLGDHRRPCSSQAASSMPAGSLPTVNFHRANNPAMNNHELRCPSRSCCSNAARKKRPSKLGHCSSQAATSKPPGSLPTTTSWAHDGVWTGWVTRPSWPACTVKTQHTSRCTGSLRTTHKLKTTPCCRSVSALQSICKCDAQCVAHCKTFQCAWMRFWLKARATL